MFNKPNQINAYQKYRIKKLNVQLERAKSYTEWQDIAQKLDRETGAEQWKLDNSSIYFNAEVIAYRLTLLRKYREQSRIQDAIYLLQEGLSYDIANIAHPMLFTVSRLGTKQIIEDYVDEVSRCLIFVAQSESSNVTLDQKIQFFQNAKIAYGQPAIMFSGGATLGLFHTGVCKALIEQDLLPNVLSGSSAGAIMAAMLAITPSDQIDQLLTGEQFYTEAFQFKKIQQVLSGEGGLADVQYLENFLIKNLGDLTFAEAHARSGVDLNITVAPYEGSQNPRILNHYTAPNVCVWSAVLASCAVPVLFAPVHLSCKRYDGVITPFMANARWVDGSVRSDFPQEKMARLYNLNYTIASQVNPHIVPFMQSDQSRYRRDLLSWPERILRRQAKVIAMGAMDFTRERVGRIEPVRRILDHGYGIIDQRYYGDVNIIGQFDLRHYRYMLQNPRPKLFQKLQREGERATWPKLSSIEIHARIGKTIQHCLLELEQSQQNLNSAMSMS